MNCSLDHQAPLSRGIPRQENWSGLPFPPPGDLPDPGIQPTSLASPALAGGFFTTSVTWEHVCRLYADTPSLYLRDLSTCAFWYPRESWNQSLADTKVESVIEPGPGDRSPASRARCLGREWTGVPRLGAKRDLETGTQGGGGGGVVEGRLCAGAGSLP